MEQQQCSGTMLNNVTLELMITINWMEELSSAETCLRPAMKYMYVCVFVYVAVMAKTMCSFIIYH